MRSYMIFSLNVEKLTCLDMMLITSGTDDTPLYFYCFFLNFPHTKRETLATYTQLIININLLITPTDILLAQICYTSPDNSLDRVCVSHRSP